MKKITTTLLLIFLTYFGANAQFPETFTGTTLPTGWAVFDNGIGTTYSWAFPTAGGFMYSRYEVVTPSTNLSQDWLVTPQFTVDATNYVLAFDETQYEEDDYSSSFTIRVSTLSQTTASDFTIVDTQTEADFPVQSWFTHTVDLSAYVGQAIYVAFVHEQNDGDVWYIDNVNMIAGSTVVPGVASNPTPVDGALAVPLQLDPDDEYSQVTFSWDAPTTGDAPLYYEFNLGTSPTNFVFSTTSSNTTFNLYGLSEYTTYYWEIIPINTTGPATGTAVWSFTTGTAALSVDTPKKEIFSVYPNPVTDILNIKGSETVVKAEVYNIAGQKVLAVENNSIIENTINLSALNRGMYIIKLHTEGSYQSIKITKE